MATQESSAQKYDILNCSSDVSSSLCLQQIQIYESAALHFINSFDETIKCLVSVRTLIGPHIHICG